LRTFSRADKEHKIPFDVREGLNSTLLILKHRLKANNIRPDIQVVKAFEEIPSIECFAGQLNQVFMNLLANAIDALDERSQAQSFDDLEAKPNVITVRTHLGSDQHHVVIQIQDNGGGMDETVQQKIFDHLFTTKDVGKGTGLGLAIAQQIVVEKHHGSIDVKSTLGLGATFTITLPIQSPTTSSPSIVSALPPLSSQLA
ncbi:MAG: GHKL domain-containing protein, partial [Merismopedia sp. SIO2A8]|nr:GHKL domain-containing protein [Merismopedia sp. SIO2A8]